MTKESKDPEITAEDIRNDYSVLNESDAKKSVLSDAERAADLWRKVKATTNAEMIKVKAQIEQGKLEDSQEILPKTMISIEAKKAEIADKDFNLTNQLNRIDEKWNLFAVSPFLNLTKPYGWFGPVGILNFIPNITGRALSVAALAVPRIFEFAIGSVVKPYERTFAERHAETGRANLAKQLQSLEVQKSRLMACSDAPDVSGLRFQTDRAGMAKDMFGIGKAGKRLLDMGGTGNREFADRIIAKLKRESGLVDKNKVLPTGFGYEDKAFYNFAFGSDKCPIEFARLTDDQWVETWAAFSAVPKNFENGRNEHGRNGKFSTDRPEAQKMMMLQVARLIAEGTWPLDVFKPDTIDGVPMLDSDGVNGRKIPAILNQSQYDGLRKMVLEAQKYFEENGPSAEEVSPAKPAAAPAAKADTSNLERQIKETKETQEKILKKLDEKPAQAAPGAGPASYLTMPPGYPTVYPMGMPSYPAAYGAPAAGGSYGPPQGYNQGYNQGYAPPPQNYGQGAGQRTQDLLEGRIRGLEREIAKEKNTAGSDDDEKGIKVRKKDALEDYYETTKAEIVERRRAFDIETKAIDNLKSDLNRCLLAHDTATTLHATATQKVSTALPPSPADLSEQRVAEANVHTAANNLENAKLIFNTAVERFSLLSAQMNESEARFSEIEKDYLLNAKHSITPEELASENFELKQKDIRDNSDIKQAYASDVESEDDKEVRAESLFIAIKVCQFFKEYSGDSVYRDGCLDIARTIKDDITSKLETIKECRDTFLKFDNTVNARKLTAAEVEKFISFSHLYKGKGEVAKYGNHNIREKLREGFIASGLMQAKPDEFKEAAAREKYKAALAKVFSAAGENDHAAVQRAANYSSTGAIDAEIDSIIGVVNAVVKQHKDNVDDLEKTALESEAAYNAAKTAADIASDKTRKPAPVGDKASIGLQKIYEDAIKSANDPANIKIAKEREAEAATAKAQYDLDRSKANSNEQALKDAMAWRRNINPDKISQARQELIKVEKELEAYIAKNKQAGIAKEAKDEIDKAKKASDDAWKLAKDSCMPQSLIIAADVAERIAKGAAIEAEAAAYKAEEAKNKAESSDNAEARAAKKESDDAATKAKTAANDAKAAEKKALASGDQVKIAKAIVARKAFEDIEKASSKKADNEVLLFKQFTADTKENNIKAIVGLRRDILVKIGEDRKVARSVSEYEADKQLEKLMTSDEKSMLDKKREEREEKYTTDRFLNYYNTHHVPSLLKGKAEAKDFSDRIQKAMKICNDVMLPHFDKEKSKRLEDNSPVVMKASDLRAWREELMEAVKSYNTEYEIRYANNKLALKTLPPLEYKNGAEDIANYYQEVFNAIKVGQVIPVRGHFSEDQIKEYETQRTEYMEVMREQYNLLQRKSENIKEPDANQFYASYESLSEIDAAISNTALDKYIKAACGPVDLGLPIQPESFDTTKNLLVVRRAVTKLSATRIRSMLVWDNPLDFTAPTDEDAKEVSIAKSKMDKAEGEAKKAWNAARDTCDPALVQIAENSKKESGEAAKKAEAAKYQAEEAAKWATKLTGDAAKAGATVAEKNYALEAKLEAETAKKAAEDADTHAKEAVRNAERTDKAALGSGTSSKIKIAEATIAQKAFENAKADYAAKFNKEGSTKSIQGRSRYLLLGSLSISQMAQLLEDNKNILDGNLKIPHSDFDAAGKKPKMLSKKEITFLNNKLMLAEDMHFEFKDLCRRETRDLAIESLTVTDDTYFNRKEVDKDENVLTKFYNMLTKGGRDNNSDQISRNWSGIMQNERSYQVGVAAQFGIQKLTQSALDLSSVADGKRIEEVTKKFDGTNIAKGSGA